MKGLWSRRGMTLTELLVAVSITTMIIAGCTMLIIMGGRMYQMGWSDSTTSMDGGLAMQRLGNELRTAAAVEIVANGSQVNYYSPTTDSDGNFTLPLMASTTQKWFRVQNGNLQWSGKSTPLLTGIQDIDPSTEQNYTPFTNVFPTATLRGLRVLLNIRKTTNAGNRDYRIGQMIYMRNMK